MNWILIVVIVLLLLAVFFFSGRYIYEGYTQKNLRNLARKTVAAFNKNGINYWVDYGTLLGIVRENDIIRHDSDVDFCILPEPDLCDKLRRALHDMGSEFHLEYHSWGAYRIKYKNMHADLYLTRIENSFYVEPTGRIPISLVGRTTIIDWNGLSVRAPEKVHETLVYRYGKNYMTSQRGKDAENGGNKI